MKYLHVLRVGWILILAIVVLGATVMSPVRASNSTAYIAKQTNSSSLNAIVYLPTGNLASIFQSRIDQQVPSAVSRAIDNMVSSLPAKDQDWANEMATTLIQPSAALVSLYPQQGGLSMALRLSLYPGDPKAITSSTLIGFGVLNSSTVQVYATPMSGEPSPINGPLTTFHIPLGSLNSIHSTPGCNNAALALNLQFPVALGYTASQVHYLTSNISSTVNKHSLAGNINSFIEVPAASLSSLSHNLGTMPVGNSFTAKNIHIVVQGGNIHILSDIYWSGFNIGSADTTAFPYAAGGNLLLNVLSTNLSIFNLFTFPLNSYNHQIQQTLNSKLGNVFAGKFYATQAGIGPNSLLPCAAGNSLVLAGTISNLG